VYAAEDVEAGMPPRREHGDDGAGAGIVFKNRVLEKNFQGFPGAAVEIRKKLPVIQKVTAEDFGDAEDEMTVRRQDAKTDKEIITPWKHIFKTVPTDNIISINLPILPFSREAAA
jgi:hypothetical protein